MVSPVAARGEARDDGRKLARAMATPDWGCEFLTKWSGGRHMRVLSLHVAEKSQ